MNSHIRAARGGLALCASTSELHAGDWCQPTLANRRSDGIDANTVVSSTFSTKSLV